MQLLFAATETAEQSAPSLPLGIDGKTLLFQFITFLLVFLVLRRFAVKPIVALLDKRHKTIDDGVRMGLAMEKQKAKFDKELDGLMREARHEADQIISRANKEAREIQRNAEQEAKKKVNVMFVDSEERLAEEAVQARKNLEKELIKMVSDVTEAIVGEKVDAKRDAELVKKAMKAQKS